MKKSEIVVGGFYLAKVNSAVVTVRVDSISASGSYGVTNMRTGRKTAFRSAAKFRREVKTGQHIPAGSPNNPMPPAPNGTPTGDPDVDGTEQHKPGDPGFDPSVQKGVCRCRRCRDLRANSPFAPTASTPAPTPTTRPAKPTAATAVALSLGDSGQSTIDNCGKWVKVDSTSERCKMPSGHDGPCYSFNNTGLSSVAEIRAKYKQAEWHVCHCPEPNVRWQGKQRLCILCGGEENVTTKRAGVTGGEQRPDPTTVRTTPATAASTSATRSSAPVTAPATERSTATKPTGLTAKLAGLRMAEAAKVEPPHVIVIARAGTGKTTTMVEGLRDMRGVGSRITPSPQQAAVWEQLRLSRDARTVCVVAFNKSIAAELKLRVPAGCDAMTMHSMGYKAVMKALGRLEPNEYVVEDHIAAILGKDLRQLRKECPVILRATKELVSLCKMNLRDGGPEDCDELARHYDVELTDGGWGKGRSYRTEVFDLVPQVLERCKEPRGRIDFDDMIWLPVVLGLPVFQYDLLLVDEAQDLNRCQQALARRAGKRLVLVGDPKQAIYGFAGADAESMPRMSRELGATKAGVVELPLTVTRRCGRAIVEEARKQVPDFEAHENNPEGRVSTAQYPTQGEGESRKELPWEQTYCALAAPGDFVLCRVNAPLVSQCFRFLKRNIRATIQGREIGKGLTALVKKLANGGGVPELAGRLDDWLNQETAKENAKRNPSEAKLIALNDKHDCLVCFMDGAASVDEVLARIDRLFTDNKDEPGIRLSSIHKAKGLEARRVFLLQPPKCGVPHPMAKSAWQREQEWNLLYVAVTRAIEELVHVS